MTTSPSSSNPSEILCVNFNQDATSLAVGTRRNFRLFAIVNGEDLDSIHESDVQDVCVVERLFSSSLITVVSLNAPRRLPVSHFVRGTEICSQNYNSSVLAVRLNRLRVVVCLEDTLFIHNIRDMKVLHTIRDTPPNNRGLMDLTPADCSLLAYPGSANLGELQIFDAANLQAVSMIPAHDSPLAALRFSSDGAKIATASEKGTVIRVFAVPSGEKLFEFRRGVKRCVQIQSLAFNSDASFLCSCSNTETIHVFKLDNAHRAMGDTDGHRSDDEYPGASPQKHRSGSMTGAGGEASGWMDYMSRTASAYLPAQVTDMLAQDRSFATAKLPVCNTTGGEKRTALALIDVNNNKQLRLMAACTDGYLYIYNVNKATGGECSLMKQHKLLSTATDSPPSTVVSQTQKQGQAAGTPSLAQTQGNLQTDTAGNGLSSATDRLHLDDRSEFPPMSHHAD